jgi:hypothetical protein
VIIRVPHLGTKDNGALTSRSQINGAPHLGPSTLGTMARSQGLGRNRKKKHKICIIHHHVTNFLPTHLAFNITALLIPTKYDHWNHQSRLVRTGTELQVRRMGSLCHLLVQHRLSTLPNHKYPLQVQVHLFNGDTHRNCSWQRVGQRRLPPEAFSTKEIKYLWMR